MRILWFLFRLLKLCIGSIERWVAPHKQWYLYSAYEGEILTKCRIVSVGCHAVRHHILYCNYSNVNIMDFLYNLILSRISQRYITPYGGIILKGMAIKVQYIDRSEGGW